MQIFQVTIYCESAIEQTSETSNKKGCDQKRALCRHLEETSKPTQHGHFSCVSRYTLRDIFRRKSEQVFYDMSNYNNTIDIILY